MIRSRFETHAPHEGASVPVTPADVAATGTPGEALLALNNAHAQELSWLEPARLRHLLAQAFLARRVGAADACCWHSTRMPTTTA